MEVAPSRESLVICLVPSNDARLQFEPVGAMPVMSNDSELLRSEPGP